MGRRKRRGLSTEEAMEFLNYLMDGKAFLPYFLPLVLLAWAIERWLFSFSNWVPVAVAVWATLQVSVFVVFVFLIFALIYFHCDGFFVFIFFYFGWESTCFLTLCVYCIVFSTSCFRIITI